MIPTFPNFKRLTLDDKTEVHKYLNKYLPYSDYNFLSLWSYNIEEDTIISILNDNLVIRFRDYITKSPFYSFLGHTKIKHTLEELLKLSSKEGLKPILKLIPETNFFHETPQGFDIQEDRDNFDYVFSSHELSELKGSRFHSQRNFINRFQLLYSSCTVEVIDIHTPEIKEAIIEIFHKWSQGKGKLKEEIEHELIALERTIRHGHFFKLFSVGIFDKENLIGFMIGDLDHADYCETHFAKADIKYTGIFYVLYNNFAKQLVSMGYKYINNEQDLGIPGLRHSKEQWNPVRFFKKYIIRRK